MTEIVRTSALIVVDLRKGILRMPPADVVTPLVETNAKLVDAFHAAG